MFINASFLSCHSPFSMISIESNVEVQFYNECNESKVKFLSLTLNTTFKYYLGIYIYIYNIYIYIYIKYIHPLKFKLLLHSNI